MINLSSERPPYFTEGRPRRTVRFGFSGSYEKPTAPPIERLDEDERSMFFLGRREGVNPFHPLGVPHVSSGTGQGGRGTLVNVTMVASPMSKATGVKMTTVGGDRGSPPVVTGAQGEYGQKMPYLLRR